MIRADHDYQPLTPEELAAAERTIADGHPNDPDVIDLFRGRQVWIDHGNGIVTRYAHTLGHRRQRPGRGRRSHRADVIAFVGDSGTPESITNPGVEEHLHFELRTGDTFLGSGLPPDEVRALYDAAVRAAGHELGERPAAR